MQGYPVCGLFLRFIKKEGVFVEKSSKKTGIDATVEKKQDRGTFAGRLGGNEAQSGGGGVKFSECGGCGVD